MEKSVLYEKQKHLLENVKKNQLKTKLDFQSCFSLSKQIDDLENSNESIHQSSKNIRVPSIKNYIDLKSRQIHLRRQFDIWKHKVQLAEHEFNLSKNRIRTFQFGRQFFRLYFQNIRANYCFIIDRNSINCNLTHSIKFAIEIGSKSV